MLEPLALCPCSHGQGGRYAHLTGRSHGLLRSQAGALPGAEWFGQRGEACCRSKGENCHLLKWRRADGVAIGVARRGLCASDDLEIATTLSCCNGARPSRRQAEAHTSEL